MENAGGFYVVSKISNKIRFMPTVRISGPASAFVAVPPLVYIEILPHCFTTKIIFFSDLNGNLEEIEFKMRGARTMEMEGTFKPTPGDFMSSQNVMYTSPRVRRVCPPLYFSASFDFPAPVSVDATDADNVNVNVLRVSPLPNGDFQFDVPRPGGEVDLSRYPFIRTPEW